MQTLKEALDPALLLTSRKIVASAVTILNGGMSICDLHLLRGARDMLVRTDIPRTPSDALNSADIGDFVKKLSAM